MDESTSPKKEWALTQEAFNKLLVCLDADRERAGERYETIRRKLMKFFECRGCPFPEEFTDEAINRVARKLDQGEELHNPSGYFYGVARMVFMESLREQEKERAALERLSLRPVPEDPDESARRQCMERCLHSLPPESRQLIVQYHQGEKRARIETREALAAQWRLPLNALRIRVHRLREKLETCVEGCLKQSAAG